MNNNKVRVVKLVRLSFCKEQLGRGYVYVDKMCLAAFFFFFRTRSYKTQKKKLKLGKLYPVYYFTRHSLFQFGFQSQTLPGTERGREQKCLLLLRVGSFHACARSTPITL